MAERNTCRVLGTRRAQLAHAAYTLGIARYHTSTAATAAAGAKLSAVRPLEMYFAAEAELAAAGEEVRQPLT